MIILNNYVKTNRCCIFKTYLNCFTLSENAEVCPVRNSDAALAVERRCRKECIPGGNDCHSDRVCLCAHECGYSCINLGNQQLTFVVFAKNSFVPTL